MGSSLSRRAEEDEAAVTTAPSSSSGPAAVPEEEKAKTTAEEGRSASMSSTANLVSPPAKKSDPNDDSKCRLEEEDPQAEASSSDSSELLHDDETKPPPAARTAQELFVPRFLDEAERHPLTRPMLEITFMTELRSLTSSSLSSDDWVGFSFHCKEEESDSLHYTVSGRPQTVKLVVDSLKAWLREYVRVLNCRFIADHNEEINIWIPPEAPVGILLKTFPRESDGSGLAFEISRSALPVQALRDLSIAEIPPCGIVYALNGIPCHTIREFKKIKQLAASKLPSNSIPLTVKIILPDKAHYLCHAPLLRPTGAGVSAQSTPTRRSTRNQSKWKKPDTIPTDLLICMNDAVSSVLEASLDELYQGSAANTGGDSLVLDNSKPSTENSLANSIATSVPAGKTVKTSFPASLDRKKGLVMCLFDVDDNFLKFRSKVPEITDWSGFSVESEATTTPEGQTLHFSISGPPSLVDAHVTELHEYLRYQVIRYNASIIEKHGVRKTFSALIDPALPLGAELSELKNRVSLAKIDPDGQLGQALASAGTPVKDYPPCGVVESLANTSCNSIKEFKGIMQATHQEVVSRGDKKALLHLNLMVLEPKYEEYLACVPSLFAGAPRVNVKYPDHTKYGLVDVADADSEMGSSMESNTKPVASKVGSPSSASLSGEKVASAKRACEPESQGEAEQQANKRLKIEEGNGFGFIGTAFSKIREAISEKLGP